MFNESFVVCWLSLWEPGSWVEFTYKNGRDCSKCQYEERAERI